VSGTRRPGSDDQQAQFYIRERFYGEFRRVITLPDDTEADQIAAEFDGGLVEITVTNGVSPTGSTKISLVDRSKASTSRKVTTRRRPDGKGRPG
jgi:HSP20 family protein